MNRLHLSRIISFARGSSYSSEIINIVSLGVSRLSWVVPELRSYLYWTGAMSVRPPVS